MRRILLLLLLAVFSQTVLQAEQPKRDVRAVWLTTVWSLDWPSSGATPASQQTALIGIINKLETANFNTIYFQVRTMCDALYNSKFQEEAWSQWLTGTRGDNPGWDPLAFIVEEAHKRGIEVHAWLNPYRYSTGTSTHGNLPTDYVNTHPEWMFDYGSSLKILNPGVPEVRERIADIVEDIITKYNVDGIIFDDYFYQNGTTLAMDQAQFDAYNPLGFTDRGDWRRENVNQMVAAVYERINSLKPWLPFGVSPAGVASSNPSVAAGHGVDPSPGNDWQYSSIFSDPVMWIRRGTVDYISPQVYWAIGSSTATDYGTIIPWWARVTNQFGRFLFSSNSSAAVNASALPAQTVAQIAVNREADLNGVTGSVLFRTNSYGQAVYNALRAEPNQYLALTANYGWKQAPIQGLVENLNVSGQNVMWNYTSTDARTDVRYAIYAVPLTNVDDADIFSSPKYLRGVTYNAIFTLPAGISSATHQIAVAVYDRFGNIFPPRIFGDTLTTVAPAVLTYPANNQPEMVIPSLFTWESNGAHTYIWQLAEDAEFTNPIISRETAEPFFNSGLQGNIQENITYYWRVLSMKANAPVSVSEVHAFNGKAFQMLTPANLSTNVSLTPELTWTNIGVGAVYTLELSMRSDFSDIAYTTTVQTTSATVSTPLRIGTTYYARVRTELGAIQAISARIQFYTEEAHVDVPTIITPTNGQTILDNAITITWEEQISRGFRTEISRNSNFPPRDTQARILDVDDYSTTYTGLALGTWYVRMFGLTAEGQTAPTPTITVLLTDQVSVPVVNAGAFVSIFYGANNIVSLVINQTESTTASIEIYSLTGNLLDTQTHPLNVGQTTLQLNMSSYAPGIYLIRVTAESSAKTLRVKR